MKKFISAIESNSASDRRKLFLDIFKFEEDELESMLFFGLFDLDSDVGQLEEQLNKMLALDFENFIKEELESLQKQYPSPGPVKFELYILDENDAFVKSKLGGVSAFTEWDGRMCFVLLPNENVRKILKSTITHEYHHHWRISALNKNEENTNLLDRMILEGLAEHFVRLELGGDYLGPYKDALSESEARTLYEGTYKQHLKETGETTDCYMFGNEEKSLPFWGGYSMGYYLVKWHIERNPGISIEVLTVLPSEKFLP